MSDLDPLIRRVPDFPKPGICFYDITTLLQDPEGMKLALDKMETFVYKCHPQKIVAVESRGFLFGGALADRLKIGVIIARKPGKLPYRTIAESYDLEYGSARIELHTDAISPGERVVVVDDLIATGGTLKAVCNLVEKLGGKVVGVSAVIDLSFLPWREKLDGYDVNCLISFDSE